MEIAAETLVVADFIFLEAVFQLAGADQADAARMARFHAFARVYHPFQRQVVVGQRVFKLAQVLIGITQIVIGPRKVRRQARGFIVEDQAFIGAAFLGQHGGQRIPQDRLMRHAVDRGPQGFNRRIGFAQVALHAAQIVVAQGRVGAGGDVKAEHLGRALGQLQVPGGEAQIDQQLGIFGIQMEGAFIGHQRLVQMAHPLQRHGQHMKGLGILGIGFGRLQRPLAGLDDVALAPGPDGALQRHVGAMARLGLGHLVDQGFQLVQRLHARVHAGQRVNALEWGGLCHGISRLCENQAANKAIHV